MTFCLELVSLSSRVLDQDGRSYDLVFDLSAEPLPSFSAIDCWRKRSISPLRDRVMIEWLFSHYEAELLLKTMTTAINEAIKERSTALAATTSSSEASPSSTLRVAIGCQNGAQHSVCFVEKLYEQYSFESPLDLEQLVVPTVDGVKVEVKRQHCEATEGEWLESKDAVWQHSQFPITRIPHHRILLFNRAWSNFPLEYVRQIEAAFLKNPFSASVDIGKHIVNFERSTLFNKKNEEEFRIRSTIPSSDEKVHSSWLQHEEYSQLHKSYTSAGILFYSVHPQTGEAVFLLGHMTYGAMAWCDFGGLKKFVEKAKYTAARECYEETFGILGKTRHLVSMLENYKENNVFKIVNEGTKYVGHFLRVPYKDYPSVFENALEVASGDIEVDEMRWFSHASLRSGIQKALLDQPVIKVEPLNEDGSIDSSQQLPLRFELVHSLCIADQLGVLKSIEHIAKTLHAENLPPPPPYISYSKPRQSSQSAKLGSKSSIPEDTSLLEASALNGDSKEEQGMCTHVDSGEESHTCSQITAPSQSQNVSTDLTSETADNNIHGKDGLRNQKREKLEPKQHVIIHVIQQPKSNTTVLKELQIATATVADTGLRMFGVGTGTFMY